jgi:hypothetical protein
MSKDKSPNESNGAKLCFIHRGIMPFLAFIIFAAAFFIFSKTFHPFIGDIDNSEIIDKFGKYAPFAGVGLGILSMLLMYVLYILRRLFRLHKTRYSAPVVLILGFAPWLALGYQLAFREPRYAMIVRAIISYGGKPMFYSSIVMAGLGILWLIVTPFIRRKA